MLYTDAAASVGRTPLVELRRIGRNLPGRVIAKLEMRNPCGSVKDRLAVALITDAERRGVLHHGATLVEATGGNTGIGLAFAAAIRGYRLLLTMPETMSAERVALLRHLGAEVMLTPGILMTDAVSRANELVSEIPGAVMLDQFRNPANVEAHRFTTAVELWEDSGGAIDVFVSAVGTGGTIMGVGSFLKTRKRDTRIVAVEPAGAALLSGGKPGQHKIPGIGVGFLPPLIDRALLDEIIPVSDDDAYAMARRLARVEGILAGPSAGAAVHAALTVASREDSAGLTVAVILADSAERYVTSELFVKPTM